MNYIISVFALIALVVTNPAYATEVKEECITTTDKAGKEVKKCKKMKVHKKLDGEKIPEKKK
jgi:hypothetical protein